MSNEKRGETFVMREPDDGGPMNFSTFLLGLASSALIHLGVAPNPETGGLTPDLTLAQQTLDVLAMLRTKTKGNLTPDEEKLFENMLTDLRFRFVEAKKK